MSKHILITGATKGIGRSCTELFAAEGWAISAVARSTSDLEALKMNLLPKNITTIVADLATEAGVNSIPVMPYDVVLLNAATFAPGPLLTGTRDTFSTLWALNVHGNHLLSRRLLPSMLAAAKGHLVVVGSLGTDYWPAHLTAYVATKYALRGLFLGWQKELVNTGVLTTLVAPGATLTSSWDNEEPPDKILAPQQVAHTILQAVVRQQTGRITIMPE